MTLTRAEAEQIAKEAIAQGWEGDEIIKARDTKAIEATANS